MKTLRISALALVFVSSLISSLFPASAATVDPMSLPKLTEYVEDFSHVLSPGDLAKLRGTARDYETKTTNQMVAILIPNRNGNELFDIGMKIFSTNQIGQKQKNNGVLLVIATDEKKIRIVTGYGLEGDIPDVLASDFIEKNIRPLVNNGKYSEAIQAFFDRTTRAIGTDEGKKLQEQVDQEGIQITSALAAFIGLAFSFNLFFLLLALWFFILVSFSVGSILPLTLFLVGAAITAFIGFHYFSPNFRENFFRMPKGNDGGDGGGGWGSGSGWGWGFSGGGGSSGGGGAGD